MCGIAGRVNLASGTPVDKRQLQEMCNLLAHRGPDGSGVILDGAVGLGHRRLAIIDLSEAAGQPMVTPDGRFTITFNGEIYNYVELRDELIRRGRQFRTDSDTEVLLAAYEAFGPGCLSKLRGMFAFAIWDARERTLFAARDRVGKKPLYYRLDRDGLAFASESKAFLADPAFEVTPDPRSLLLYLTYGYIPAPFSIFTGVRQLEPGHYLVYRDGKVETTRYWSLAHMPKRHVSEQDALAELDELLTESVRLRLISDVPIGAFLSGGVDSGTVVALMARCGGPAVKTFSIGFDERDFSELTQARAVAERYGTRHHEIVVRPDALAVLPTLTWHYGEPFADSSAIPTYYVAQATRQHVTVALNGDGGDESFAGYSRYIEPERAAMYGRIPHGLRTAAARMAGALPAGHRFDSAWARSQRWLTVMQGHASDRYTQSMMSLDAHLRRRLCTADFLSRAEAAPPEELLAAQFRNATGLDEIDAMLAVDVNTYLPGDILVKVDIATMANSLEGRSPFLDHRVMEFAATLPSEMKLHRGVRKYLLKQFARRFLPSEIIDRPKKGFSVPLADWLRGDLREMVHDVLLDRRADRGILEPQAVARLVHEHETGAYDWQGPIWTLLMLELWYRRFVDDHQRLGAEQIGSLAASGSRQ
jgi:asparagine synthase (glutamine-hydrolysing)